MNYKLPNLTALLVGVAIAGRAGGEPPASPPSAARVASSAGSASNSDERASNSDERASTRQPVTPQQVVKQAVEILAQRRSVVAKIRYRGHLFDQTVIGAGDYWQGPLAQAAWRLELKAQIGAGSYALQQVCDGDTLWIQRGLGDSQELAKVDMAAVRARQSQGAAPPDALLTSALGAGGLPRLMSQLERYFQFDRVGESQLYGVPTYVVAGRWSPTALAALAPTIDKRAIQADGVDASRLPPQLPESVTLYLGRDDLFPYRIEYHRSAHATLVGAAETPPMLVAELYEVQFDVRLERSRFEFEPGDAPVIDMTSQWLTPR